MFKHTSKNFFIVFYVAVFALFLQASLAKAQIEGEVKSETEIEVNLIERGQITEPELPPAPEIPPAVSTTTPEAMAVIEKFVDESHLVAVSTHANWQTGEILTVVSQNAKIGTIAFVEVVGVVERPDSLFEIKLSLQRQSRKYFVQRGDFVRQPDLSDVNQDYMGTTDLLIRDSRMKIASRYRPLVHQGFVIGDTAQTLLKKEYLLNYFGNVYYGLSDRVTVGTLAPANFLGRPNFNFRIKVYDSDSTTITSGLSFVRLVKEDQASLNLNFYWDNTSSDALISHTFVGLGLISWDKAGDAAALKYLTSSSLQTGYEILLDNWDRVLIGPSYNFEKKALGGYFSYIWIHKEWHVQLSLNATDVTKLRFDPTDGYYGFFDIFWRF